MKKLLALLFAGLIVLGATACKEQGNAIQLINQSRSEAFVGGVDYHPTLFLKAQKWADTMASSERLAHSNLSDGLGAGWQLVGENVGYASSIEKVHSAFLESPAHRKALLDPRYTHVGVGVTERNGRLWVAVVFAG